MTSGPVQSEYAVSLFSSVKSSVNMSIPQASGKIPGNTESVFMCNGRQDVVDLERSLLLCFSDYQLQYFQGRFHRNVSVAL